MSVRVAWLSHDGSSWALAQVHRLQLNLPAEYQLEVVSDTLYELRGPSPWASLKQRERVYLLACLVGHSSMLLVHYDNESVEKRSAMESALLDACSQSRRARFLFQRPESLPPSPARSHPLPIPSRKRGRTENH